jgi:hypothetical protein
MVAKQRDLQPRGEGERLEGLSDPVGYMLGKDQQVKDVFAVEAELLRSEGIDPEWPRFNQADD